MCHCRHAMQTQKKTATYHYHVWRLLREHGVPIFGMRPVMVREDTQYRHRTSGVRAAQRLMTEGRCDGYYVWRCDELHTLDDCLSGQEAR